MPGLVKTEMLQEAKDLGMNSGFFENAKKLLFLKDQKKKVPQKKLRRNLLISCLNKILKKATLFINKENILKILIHRKLKKY